MDEYLGLTDAEVLSIGWFSLCIVTDKGGIRCRGQQTLAWDSGAGGRYTDVAVGRDAGCALYSDGQGVGGDLECWGDNARGAHEAPDGRFVAVELAENRGCGITDHGAIQCWGRSEPEMGQPPDGTWVDLRVADWHACAQSDAGQWRCWGWPAYFEGFTPGAYLDVAVSRGRTCTVSVTGELACYGVPWLDEHDFSPWGNAPYYEWFPEDGSYRSVSLGLSHACALTSGSEIRCWGENDYGEATPPG